MTGAVDAAPLDGVDVVLADLDGVVYAGHAAIPHAVEALNAAAASGRRLGYLTNNASRTADAVASQLRELGLGAEAHDIVSSPQAAVVLLRELVPAGATVLVVGGAGLLEAVEGAFGGDVDYAQVIKQYGPTPTPAGRYSPAECIGVEKKPIEGNPDPRYISTSFVEVHNKTMRMHMRRFTRLTNGHSKKVANHVHMVALYTLFYNFIRTHGKLRMTPAMAAGIATTFLSFEDVLARIDAAQTPKARGPYKKRAA